MVKKKADILFGIIFLLLSISFVAVALTNERFFQWAFERHQNQLSWYIRPLFLVPFCFFSYKKSIAGIGATVLGLLTSMFWFPIPENVPEKVNEFLSMEMAYLHGSWDLTRIIFTMFIPATFILLAYVIWKRQLKTGIYIIAFMAFIKIVWGIMEGGKSGTSIIIPALVGLVITITSVNIGSKSFEKRKKGNQ